MHRILIENYIKQIKKNDIELSDEEVELLYHYLNNYWEDLLYGDSRSVFLSMEKKLDKNQFLKIQSLFKEYYDKYQNFL